MIKDWDLNIYFLEEWDENVEEYVLSDTLRINPVLWTMADGASNVEYTNRYIETTFAETRYLRSQYPEHEYGYDWTDSLTNFLTIAPPRLRSLLATLPDPETMDIGRVKDLVGWDYSLPS